MSFELYFSSKRPALSEQDFSEWFANRECYDSDAISLGQALYENQATGVHFIIEFGVIFDAEDEPELDKKVEAVLLLNYCRPGFFARECLIELQAFIEKLGLLVCDPQADEDVFSEFNADRFLKSFLSNNASAAGVIQEHTSHAPLRLPTGKLDEMWQWNYNKGRLQAELGDEVFVPTLYAFEHSGEVQPGVVWTDGIPMVVPPCDTVLVNKTELSVSGQMELHLHQRPALGGIFADHFLPADANGCLHPKHPEQPDTLEAAFAKLPATWNTPTLHEAATLLDG